MYQVLHNNKMVCEGLYWDCFNYILKVQSFSVDFAIKYCGYEIVVAKKND